MMAKDPKRGVSIPVDQVKVAFQDINEYVVSLDRIISRIGAGGENPQILLDYVIDRGVFGRLADLREKIGDALEAEIGEDAVDELAEASYRYGDE